MRLRWNTATSFCLGGYLLAGGIAWAYLGWYWLYLPGIVAACVAGFGVSTWLGVLAARNASGLLSCLLGGVGIAIATLMAGVFALGGTNVLLSWLEVVMSVRWGFGPYYSLAESLEDFVIKPAFWVALFGGWIAILLGLVYGTLLYRSSKARHALDSTI